MNAHRRWSVGLLAALVALAWTGARSGSPGSRSREPRSWSQDVAPPPVLPIPTARQLAWQAREMALFLHFGVNTFTDREWGEGTEDPSIFNPTDLDARQWAVAAREAGFRSLILTAKHHDGFTLWPSALTSHSVASSGWRDGRGDVLRDLADATRAEGLELGVYLSPWDRHEPSYGDERRYNEFYLAQLRELLTGYGPIAEVWFDGAKGENAKDMRYDFAAYRALVRQLQPTAVMFSDAGPDVRWIGNERGFAGETNWSMLDRSRVTIGKAGQEAYLNAGDPEGPDWVPGECDVSIRPGWFWHAREAPKSLDALLEIYFKSVGRNCVLLLNVPPDPRGRLAEGDVARLLELRLALDDIFATDVAAGASATASGVWHEAPRFGAPQAVDASPATYWAASDAPDSAWLELDLGAERSFDVARLEEPIALGQRIAAYRLEVYEGGDWRTIARGTTVGYRKLDRFDAVTARRVRLVIERARAVPLVSSFELYHMP